jgi:hypothetical protein
VAELDGRQAGQAGCIGYDAGRDALDHSIRKWTGLLPENLEKHGVEARFLDVYDGDTHVTCTLDTSCALCTHYLIRDANNKKCPLCPITKSRGTPCDVSKGYTPSPWAEWLRIGDPRPMLDALKAAKESIEGGRDLNALRRRGQIDSSGK